MPDKTLLTVLIPVHNGARTLARALDSLVAQTNPNFKAVIVDNGSEDETPEIAARFTRDDPRFSYHRNAQNFGLLYSSVRLFFGVDTPYCAILHADLAWAPAYAEECLRALEDDPEAVIAYSQCQFVTEDGRALELHRDRITFDQPDPAERYLTMIKHLAWCIPYHGVLRYQAAVEPFISLFQHRNAAGDNEFLALMALRGKLIQVEKPLFRRVKDAHQITGELMPDRYRRLYRPSVNGPINLPFCSFIRDYCHNLTRSGLPLEVVDDLIQKTITVLLGRYQSFIEYELTDSIQRIIDGRFKATWGGEADQEPAAAAQPGQYRYIDFVYLSEWLRDLDYAALLRPGQPFLYVAKAMILATIGKNEEAATALNQELKRDPSCRLALDLKSRWKL